MRRIVAASAFVIAIAFRASAATFAVNVVDDGHDAALGNGVCEATAGNPSKRWAPCGTAFVARLTLPRADRPAST